jgi:hypothetical protein
MHSTNIKFEAVMFLPCILELPGSNLGLDTGYQDFFSLFSSVFLGRYEIVPYITLPFISVSIHYSLSSSHCAFYVLSC